MTFWRGLLIGTAISAVQIFALRGKGPSMDWAPLVLFGPAFVTVVASLVFLLRGERGAALGICLAPLLAVAGLFVYAAGLAGIGH